MQAGKLDRKILIEQPTETRDSYGEPVATWATLATVFGQKLDVRGTERFQSEQQLGEEVTRFLIRYRSDVTAKMRLTVEGKVYDIEGIAEVAGRHRWLELIGRAQNV